jgi:hypothetical protein
MYFSSFLNKIYTSEEQLRFLELRTERNKEKSVFFLSSRYTNYLYYLVKSFCYEHVYNARGKCFLCTSDIYYLYYGRWALKEAVFKALSPSTLTWRDIATTSNEGIFVRPA